MKLFIKLLLTIIIVPGFLMAQRNYKAGYILRTNGDTVKGYINYRDWSSNPTSILFKKELTNTSTQTYAVANTSGFGLYGIEYYTKYTGNISTDQIDIGYLKNFVDTSSRTDTVFLRVMARGKNVTLYEYKDVIKTRYFVSSGNTSPEELTYHAYLIGDKVQKVPGYMKQLQALSAIYQPQSPQIIDDIAAADYTAESLKRMIFKINGSGSDATTGKTFVAESHGGVRLFGGLGISSASVRFIGDNDFTTLGASTSIFPEVNLGADIYFNKEVGNLLVRTILNVTGNSVSFNYNSGGSFPYNTVLKFNQYIVALQPQLLYNLHNTAALKFYISAGAGINISSYKNMQYYRINANGTTSASDMLTAIGPHGVFFNMVTNLGVMLNNKIDIYAGYSPNISIDYETIYSMQYSSIHAGVHYLFGK